MNSDFEKLVLHVSTEMSAALNDASEKLKLSKASIIRQALDEFFVNKGINIKKKSKGA